MGLWDDWRMLLPGVLSKRDDRIAAAAVAAAAAVSGIKKWLI